MAERSKAAVEDSTETAQAEAEAPSEETEAAAAAAEALSTEVEAAPSSDDTTETDAPSAPERHSGDRIAGRYRLDECITQGGEFTSWRAVDEKLRRSVGIHLMASGHERAKQVLAAARQAALLGDPRFVQVLDAVEDGELLYIVREWLPDATGLDKILPDGPLDDYEAYQLVRQVSDALAAAHRRGLSHLRLTPACVLRTDSGQFRVDGIAVNAALRGLAAEDQKQAELQDTRAVGSLLFAALTRRWPEPEGRGALPGLPKGTDAVVPPARLGIGVHGGLSDLTARILCAEPPRDLKPITAPQDLAAAVTQLPKVRPPAPEPLVLPDYPGRHPHPQVPAAPTATVPPRSTPSAPTTGAGSGSASGSGNRALKWGMSVLVLAAIGLGSWGVAQAILDQGSANATSTQLQQSPTQHAGDEKNTDTGSGKLLTITAGEEFSPRSSTLIDGKDVTNAFDGNTSTAWVAGTFHNYANFGNLPTRADGSGIVVDLGSEQTVSKVTVTLPYAGGQKMEILAAPPGTSATPKDLSGFGVRVADSATVPGLDWEPVTRQVTTRFLLIHVLALPAKSASDYVGGISEIRVYG